MKSVGQLKVEILDREERGKDIRRAITQFCKERYGIDDFFGVADQFFASVDGFAVCLARQVPTINVEHVACHLLSKWLSSAIGRKVVTLPLSLIQDTYVSNNRYKVSLVKLPWLTRSKKNGQLVVNNEKITYELLEGRELSSIGTISGMDLPKYHLALRDRVFGPNVVVELSPFFQQLLMESLNSGKGPEVAYQIISGQVARVRPKPGMKNLRPLSDWVYLFHLMLFLDGKRALLSTVGDNDEVGGWFARAIRTIEGVVGLPPFIIDTPVSMQVENYQSNLLEYPIRILKDDWQEGITMLPIDPSLSVFQIIEDLERQVITLA